MKIRKARGDKAVCFQIHTDDEGEGDDEILEGERPFEQDEGAVYQADDEDDADEDASARGNPKSFFPSTKPKAKATLPSGKGTLPRGDVGSTFPNGKLVDEKIDFSQWPSITAFRAWKLSVN